jgi:hypothetical protein
MSAFVVVHVNACAPSFTVLPLLNTAHIKNIELVLVTPVTSDSTSVWLKAKHRRNIFLTSISALVVVHVSEFAPSSIVLPLLNLKLLENIAFIVVTPVTSERVSVWLNAQHWANIVDVLVSALVVVNVNGFAPSSTGLPLLKTVHWENIDTILSTLLMSEKDTVWLNATHNKNMESVYRSAVVVHVSGDPPLLNTVQFLNMFDMFCTLDVSHADKSLLKLPQAPNMNDMSVTALTSHVPMFDAAAVKAKQFKKHSARFVVVGRRGEPVVAVICRFSHPEK